MPKMYVPQESGEITISVNGPQNAKTWKVSGNSIDVDDADVELIRSQISGSKVQKDSAPSSANGGNSSPAGNPGV